MNKLKFTVVWLVLGSMTGWAAVLIYSSLNHPSSDQLLSITWLVINQLGPLSLIGIGLGLPIALVSLLFGWVQLILIIEGLIPPHLSSKGFIEALYQLIGHGRVSLQ